MANTRHFAMVGRPFREDWMGEAVELLLEELRGRHPGMVRKSAGGVWWIGEPLAACRVPEWPEPLGPVAAEPAPGQEERVRAFLGSLPREIREHPDLAPLGLWAMDTADAEDSGAPW